MDFTWKNSLKGDYETSQAVDSLWELWDDTANGGRAFRILECLILKILETDELKGPERDVLDITWDPNEDGVKKLEHRLLLRLGEVCGLNGVWFRYTSVFASKLSEFKRTLYQIRDYVQISVATYDSKFNDRPMLMKRLVTTLSKCNASDDPTLSRDELDPKSLPELYAMAQRWGVTLDDACDQIELDQLMQNAKNPTFVGPGKYSAEAYIEKKGGDAYRGPLVEKILENNDTDINNWAESMRPKKVVKFEPIARIMLIWCECKLYEQILKDPVGSNIEDFLRVLEPITRGPETGRVVGYKSVLQRTDIDNPDDPHYTREESRAFDGFKRTSSINQDMHKTDHRNIFSKTTLKDSNKCNPCYPQALFSRMRNLYVTGLLGNYQLVCLFDSFFWTKKPTLADPIIRLGKMEKTTRDVVEDEHKNRTQFQNMGGFLNHHARFDEAIQTTLWRAMASDTLRGIPFPMTELSRLRKDGFTSSSMDTYSRMFFDFDIVWNRRMNTMIEEEMDPLYKAATVENIARLCQAAIRKAMVGIMTHRHIVDDKQLLREIKKMGDIVNDTNWYTELTVTSATRILDFECHKHFISDVQKYWVQCVDCQQPLKINNDFQNLARQLENMMRNTIVDRLLTFTVSVSPQRLVTPLKKVFADTCDISETLASLYLTGSDNDIHEALAVFNREHSFPAEREEYAEWSAQSFHTKIQVCSDAKILLKTTTFKLEAQKWKNSFHIVFPFLPTRIHDQIMIADICRATLVSERKLRAIFSESELDNMVDCAIYTGRPKLRPNFSLKLMRGGCRASANNNCDLCCDLQQKEHNNDLICANCLVTPATKSKGTNNRNWFTFAALVDCNGDVKMRRMVNPSSLLKKNLYFQDDTDSRRMKTKSGIPGFMKLHWNVQHWQQQTDADVTDSVCCHRLELIVLGNATKLDSNLLELTNSPTDAMTRELQMCSIHGFPDAIVCCYGFDDTQDYRSLRSLREVPTEQVNLWDSEAKNDFGGRLIKRTEKLSGVRGHENTTWIGFDCVMAGTNCIAQTLDTLLLPEIRFLLVYVVRDPKIKGWSKHCFQGDESKAIDYDIDINEDEYPFRRLLMPDQQKEEQLWANPKVGQMMKTLTEAKKNKPQQSVLFPHEEIIMASHGSQYNFEGWSLDVHLLRTVQTVFGDSSPEESAQRVRKRLLSLSQYYGPRFSGEMLLIGHAAVKKIQLRATGSSSSMDIYFHNSEKFTPCPHLCQGGVVHRDSRMSMARGAPQSHLTDAEMVQQNLNSRITSRCFEPKSGGYHRSEWNRSYVRVFFNRQSSPKDAIVLVGRCEETTLMKNTLRAALRCPAQNQSKHEQFLYSRLHRDFPTKPCNECGSGFGIAYYPQKSMSSTIPDHVFSEMLRGVIFPTYFERNGLLKNSQKKTTKQKITTLEGVDKVGTKRRPPIEQRTNYCITDSENKKGSLSSQHAEIIQPSEPSKRFKN